MNKVSHLLITKFMITFISVLLSIGLLDRNSSLLWLLTLALIGTFLNYLIGDLLIFETFGNITASLTDGIITAVAIYTLAKLSRDLHVTILGLIFFIALLAIGEYSFHLYLLHSKK